jgi:long-chain acyl-CoA synthetase
MADLGFWALAQADPDHLALVLPDGTELSAGTLAGRVNQVVHGLRTAGVGVGDAVATVLPNGTEIVELYLAALQAGWYLVPINHHLVGPEIAYILSDSEAKVLVGHERFAAACKEAAAISEMPPEGLFAVGEIEGFKSFSDLRDREPTTVPEDRTLGDVMNYTSGTTGQP